MGKQKRSENTYQKINTLYKRDINNIIMQHYEWSCPEFEYLRSLLWDASEKIDGTNMRIEVIQRPVLKLVSEDIVGVQFDVIIKGKTDNAQIPPHLEKYMKETFTDDKVFASLGIKEYIPIEEWAEHGWCVSKEDPTPMYEKIPEKYTLYGEGYGMNITLIQCVNFLISVFRSLLLSHIIIFIFVYYSSSASIISSQQSGQIPEINSSLYAGEI